MATERVEIELALRGADGVYNDLKKLDSMLQGFGGAKGKKQIEFNLGQSQQELMALRGEINQTTRDIERLKKTRDALRNQRSNFDKESAEYEKLSEAIDEATEQIDDAKDHLREVKNEFKDVTQRVNELRYALKNFSQMSFGKMFKEISTGLKHAGQNMQTLGNALQRIGNPFQRFTTGMAMGAGYKALNLATEGLESAFDRYDTMKKYPKMMKQLGYTKNLEEGEKSIKRLDEAVTGLPTSLDEIVSSAQRYTLSLGNMTKGENLAIAANNAFLASMSTEQQQYQGMMQLADLASGATLRTQEWNSLIKSMPAAIKAVGKELGYTDTGAFEKDLRAGNIAGEDFLNTLIKVGVGKDSALGKMAELSKETFESLRRNTKTAFSRLGYGVLTALDEVSKGYNGKTLIKNLLEAKGVIDQWRVSLTNWIKAHPDEIIDFFVQLKNIDWGGFARGMVDGIKSIMDAVQWFAGLFEGKGLSKLGWFMMVSGPLGRAINTFGGFLKGLSHPLALILAGTAKLTMMTKGELGKGGGLIGMVGRLLAGGGKASEATKATEAMENAGRAADAASTAAPKMSKFGSALSGFFKGWAEIAVMVGGSAFVGWASVKLIKNAFKDIRELGEIVADIDWGPATTGMLLAGDFIVALIGVGKLIGNNPALMKDLGLGTLLAGAVTLFASGTFWADMAMIKKGFKAISDSAKYLNTAVDELQKIKSIDQVGGVKNKVKNAITALNQIKDLFKGKLDPNTLEFKGGLEKFPKTVAKSMKNVTDTIANMKTAIDTLNELSGMKIDADGINDIIEPFGDALSNLRTVILQIPSEWKEAGIVDATGNLSSSLANLKTTLESIVGKNGILGRIPQLIQQTTGFQDYGVYETFIERMKQIGGVLKGAYDALNSGLGSGEVMMSNLDNFRQALKSAKFAIMHLQAIGDMNVDDSVVKNIKDIFAKIKDAFNQDQINEISTAITTFKDSIQTALDSFEELNTDIEINPTVKTGDGFDSSVKTTISDINKKKNKIKREGGKSVSFSISVRAFFRVVTNFASAMARITRERQALWRAAGQGNGWITPHVSTGGMATRQGVLYRSGGGSVFKPRGTDTIPAMLTPGEYVQKKQAVDFFGLDFMRKVNNMDVRGAMNALLTKARTSVGVGRQSIVNNTVNNNQRITQNISTNNPNFARARMGRFVGAL